MEQNDNKSSSDNYSFIKETIKEKPRGMQKLSVKLLTAALCGITFGVCAGVTASLIVFGVNSTVEEKSEKHEEVTIVSGDEAADNADEGLSNDLISASEDKNDAETDEISEMSDQWNDQVRKAVENPRKALVRIEATGDDSDLLDDTLLDYGEEDGLIFLKNSEAFYILTYSEKIGDANSFQVVFSNDDTAKAELCKKDARTNIYVFRVLYDDVKKETQTDIPAATLTKADDVQQMDSVVALGRPTGEYDSIVTGIITSVTGTIETADEEYSVLTTDMVGSDEAGGILINMSGEVVGIITHDTAESNDVIRAVEVSQLVPLLEGMANSEDICYLGICGTTIEESQAENLDIPVGMYVDCVETNSPAMKAGVQDGDILYSIDDTEIKTVSEYSKKLQSMSKGSRVKLGLYRKNMYGTYSKIEINVTVKEK